jgi:hypothetical protein
VQEDGFDVLAGAEAVDAKIHAVAGEVALAEVAHLDRVTQAAAGTHVKVGEDRMLRIGIGDGERLLASAEAAFVDFIRVGRAPVVG